MNTQQEPYDVFIIDDIDKLYLRSLVNKYMEEYDVLRVLNDMVGLAYADGYSARENEARDEEEIKQLRRDFP